MRVSQEFYCNDCDGYFRVTLNMALNINVRLKCPNCGHLHDRHVKEGLIFDGHSGNFRSIDEIEPMRSTYSKTAICTLSRVNMRNGVLINESEKDLIRERWQELYGDRV